MTGIQKTAFAVMAGTLLAVSLSLLVYAPVAAMPRRIFRFAMEIALLLFFLATCKGKFIVREAWFSNLLSPGASWLYMAVVLGLDLCVLFLGDNYMGARRAVWEIMRVSVLTVPLATCFAGIQLARPSTGWAKTAAVAAALSAHVILLILEPDIFAVGMQLLCLFFLGIVGNGERRCRTAFLLQPFFFFVLASLYVGDRQYLQQRMTSWMFPLNDPYGIGYQVVQIRTAFRKAGLLGMDSMTAREAALTLVPDAHQNALPHLSLLWGNISTALYILLLLALLVLLLRRIPLLHGPRRNTALGLWFFLAVGQFCGIGSPFGILPTMSGYGVAFLSGGMGCLILLLGILCLSVGDVENAVGSTGPAERLC
jgi:rod shape determining protein RodA